MLFLRVLIFSFFTLLAFQANAQPYRMIPGNWSNSCQASAMEGTTMVASCQNGRGQWVAARLTNATQCTNISAQNGQLVCSGGPPPSMGTTAAGVYNTGLTGRALERFNYCMNSGMENGRGYGNPTVLCEQWAQ
jgi:hypothetical protein